MDISNVLSLFGGLGAFLFGMHYMGEGLQLAAGSKMKDLLEKLTRIPVMGFLVGMLVTVCIQSSSATTVMAMGFINAGIMDLAQATGVIFGANIGTTITSILIALDVSAIAPICIAIGAGLMLYAKKKKRKHVGQVILGFGLLFQGLHTMSGSMAPLKDSVVFQNFILNAKNPIIGFLIGVILCMVIQSSSAAVGILQALAMQGLMPLYFAAFIICGINVGSSSPVILSALNAKNNAKRAAIIYFVFNAVGALIFIPLVIFSPLTDVIASKVASASFQVSFFHIMFKLATGIVLLPLTNLVVKMTYRLLPKQAHESSLRLQYIDKTIVAAPSVMVIQVSKEVGRVVDMVRQNLVDACEGITQQKVIEARRIRDNEETIDFLTGEIVDYISKANTIEMPEEESGYLAAAFQGMNDIEQIGDHACKLLDQNERCVEGKITFSETACAEFRLIYQEIVYMLDRVIDKFNSDMLDEDFVEKTRKEEIAIKRMCAEAQDNHMKRMNNGECGFDQGLAFVEELNSLNRIANHLTSMAESTQLL
ncbi:MAG: Na/Pi cotransporter family protein [Lachnospiraceae bacterium]|nr:Na/Pi cotransporter family protein [Lachnospiraceae bacterium]